ncbi:hypothetical protein OIU79_021326 [Salix purpurea]|uniref:Uncharacterized protein n=1 Tax=Salix purpurea TaxID=77065 RepID=A0A9Q0WR85_SALPP|nr:hypothetical protein OIU79_021326 [Salix purpurea]
MTIEEFVYLLFFYFCRFFYSWNKL